MPTPEVTNLPVPGGAIEERRVKALEDQAAAMLRSAVASEKIATAQASAAAPFVAGTKADRFERLLHSCIRARLGADVESIAAMASEFGDVIDREFPTGT